MLVPPLTGDFSVMGPSAVLLYSTQGHEMLEESIIRDWPGTVALRLLS